MSANELQEVQLTDEVTAVEKKALDLVIATDKDYEDAGAFVKQVKATAKRVEEYWEPMRKTTYEAYKNVTDHKSQMLEPLKNAEKTIKGKISAYHEEVERRRQEEEEAARRAAQEEAERKMAEAREAELNGDFEKADAAMAEAEVMEQASGLISVFKEEPKVSGIIKKADWEIVSIDSNTVPVSLAGIELRPVDEKAVMALIRATKGKVVIPGVEYKETVSISVRTR